jgi:hypothetical protein
MMQPTPNVQSRLKELAEIYVKAKLMVLLAEELDPSFRSNVMVIKELRDSNDHLMRLFEEWFINPAPEKNEKYMLAQIDKARGHIFRAGYDAIDGIVVSYKIKAAKAMEKISNEAITAIYPDYYSHAVEVDILSEKVAFHRNEKDVADDSLKNLEDYAEDAKRVATFCKTALSHVPRMIHWDKKQRRADIWEKVILAILLLVIGSFSLAYAEKWVNGPEKQSSAPATQNNKFPH